MTTVYDTITEGQVEKVREILDDLIDIYGDFYITQNNLRLFIKDNFDLLLSNIANGDKVFYTENGIALVTGLADNFPRKYIKLLSSDSSIAEFLLKIIIKNSTFDLYAKLKKNNPLVSILQRNGFYFTGGRGKEILLCRKHLTQVNKEQANVSGNSE